MQWVKEAYLAVSVSLASILWSIMAKVIVQRAKEMAARSRYITKARSRTFVLCEDGKVEWKSNRGGEQASYEVNDRIVSKREMNEIHCSGR